MIILHSYTQTILPSFLYIQAPHIPSQLEVNLALGQPTWQYTTNAGMEASRAVDGNYDHTATAGSCSRTAQTPHPWWAVDLGQTYELDRVMLVGSTDSKSSIIPNYKTKNVHIVCTSNL